MENPTIVERWHSWAPQMRSLLRIVAGVVFIQYGTMKMFGWPMGMPPGVSMPVFSEIWFAGMLELVGGALFIFGLCTRPVAFILSGEMAVAYFQGHAPKGFWTMVNGGADAVLYCFLFLYFSSAGAGPWSIDALLRRNRQTSTRSH